MACLGVIAAAVFVGFVIGVVVMAVLAMASDN